MQVHTLIIGTSKSKNQNGYYIEAKEKFWGLLHKSGVTTQLLEPSEFKTLTEKHGIGFSELAFDHIHFGDPEKETYSNDSLLKKDIEVLQEGTPQLMKHLLEVQPKRIVFNGKTSASIFLQQMDLNKVEEVSAKYVNLKGHTYGHIGQWQGIEMYMLPNLSAAAGKSWKDDHGAEKWLQFWQSIRKDCQTANPKWIWITLFLLTLATILIITKK